MILKRKEDRSYIIAAMGLGVTITTIYATLVAYSTATSFKAGYLAHFGIDIHHVGYQPSIADLMNRPIVITASILVSIAIYVVIALILNLLLPAVYKMTRRLFRKDPPAPDGEKVFGVWIITGSVIALLLALPFASLSDSYDSGIESAKQQTNFTIVTTESHTKEVLIYQKEGTGFFKNYDIETNTFSPTYAVMEIKGITFEAVPLKNK